MTRETVGAALCRGGEALRRAGIESARLDARLLLSHALGQTPEFLLRERHAPIDTAAFNDLLARRAAREPLAYIIGSREFWSLRLAVSPVTLVPRPESETLIDAALDACPDRSNVRRILDLGTGTGALLLAALSEFQTAFGIGVDRNAAAVALAAANANALGLAARAAFAAGDWGAAIGAQFDLILCNPPYIATGDVAGLMPEVAGFEPRSALDGGADGLAAYREVVREMPRLLRRGGAAVLELGVGQEPAVAELARISGLASVSRPDLAGIARALVVRAG